MTADETPQQDAETQQNTNLPFIETAPAETPTTQQTPKTEPSTAVDQFVKAIEGFSSREEARPHFAEIAEKIGCSPQLGYKAEKKIAKWKTKKTTAKPATFKIKDETQNIPAPTEETPPDTMTQQQEPPQLPPQPTQPYNEPIAPDELTQLKTVIEHQTAKTVNDALDLIGSKLGATGGEAFLDQQDSADLAILLPHIIADVTGSQMTPENTKKTAYGVFAAHLIVKGVKNRLNNPPQETPPTQPTQPANTTPPQPQPQKTQTSAAKDGKPSWYKELPH
jgi:hypothetical protein